MFSNVLLSLLFAFVVAQAEPLPKKQGVDDEGKSDDERFYGHGGGMPMPGPMNYAITRRLERIEDTLERMYSLMRTHCFAGGVGIPPYPLAGGVPPPMAGGVPPYGGVPNPLAGGVPPYGGVPHGARPPYVGGLGPVPYPPQPIGGGWVRGVGEDDES